MTSETRYARAGGTHIAYRVIGDGPITVLLNTGFISHVELMMTERRVRDLFERIGEFARVLLFDRRGVGLSDPVERVPTLEQQVDDARAVLDAEAVDQAVVYGFSVGAPFAVLMAASEPERISHLVLSSGFAKMTKEDGYPHGNPPEVRSALSSTVIDSWGTGLQVTVGLPSLASDPGFREWASALERNSASPGSVGLFLDFVGAIDVRPVLSSVQQPTLLLHPPASPFFETGHSEYLAEHLPNATYVELPGADLTPVTPEATDVTINAISEFLTGKRPPARTDRALRTLLFTDIVDSTGLAARVGDRSWHDLLDRHDSISRSAIADHRGKVIKATGDGFFASFDGPERAVRSAKAIGAALESEEVQIRAGVHTGECEIRGDDLAGISVHIGARVAAEAGPDEVLVSRTVKDLVVGSDLITEPRGEHELKGVPGSWELFAVL